MRTATRRNSLSGTPRYTPLMPSGLQISSCRNWAMRAAIDTAQDLAIDVAVIERVVGGPLADRIHRLQAAMPRHIRSQSGNQSGV